MISLTNYIKNETSHIRNIYIIDNDIDEQLNDIKHKTKHSKLRKLGFDDMLYSPSDNQGGITNKDIYKIFELVDYIILEGLELNKIKNTNDFEYDNRIGITKGDKNSSIMIICNIINYNKNDSKYDISLITVGRRNKFQDIDDVKLRIYIKGQYKQIEWNIKKKIQ